MLLLFQPIERVGRSDLSDLDNGEFLGRRAGRSVGLLRPKDVAALRAAGRVDPSRKHENIIFCVGRGRGR